MTVILHIGYHKTGSTALQSWLSNNRLALAEENIVFPIGASSWLGHPEIAWACSGAKYSWQDKSYTLAEIEDFYTPYLEQSVKGNKMLVLSSEEFCRLDFSFEHLEILSRFLKKYNPIILGYFRDPISFLLSRYRHEVQHGSETRQLREYIECEDNIQSANFYARTSRWENVFGNRCIFRNYSHQSFKLDAVKSFFELIDKMEVYDKISNASVLNYKNEEKKLHPLFLDFLRTANINKYNNDIIDSNIYDMIFYISNQIPQKSMKEYAKYIGIYDDIDESSFNFLDGINQSRTFQSLENSTNKMKDRCNLHHRLRLATCEADTQV